MKWLDWLFPRDCILCREPASSPVCPSCERTLAWSRGSACTRCGAASLRPCHECVECHGKPMEFDGAVALGAYSDSFRDLVLALKHPQNRDLAPYFADRLAPRLSSWTVDLVTCVPMTRWDYITRGYNHASELAESLARRLGRPFEEHCLLKVRSTLKQKELPLSMRLRNPREAFQVKFPGKISGRHLLLVDDVLTTGATLSACAAPLWAAGAASVRVAVVTRG